MNPYFIKDVDNYNDMSHVFKYEYRAILKRNISKSKCKHYDKVLNKSPNIKNVPKFDPELNFTFNTLIYIIDSIECIKIDSNVYKLYFNIKSDDRFGTFEEIDFFGRLIEYGDFYIKPYKLFFKCMLKLRRKYKS